MHSVSTALPQQVIVTFFVDHVNGRHETIKFTLKSSINTINFLAITVNKEGDGSLFTTLYCKPTDSHNYLLYLS